MAASAPVSRQANAAASLRREFLVSRRKTAAERHHSLQGRVGQRRTTPVRPEELPGRVDRRSNGRLLQRDDVPRGPFGQLAQRRQMHVGRAPFEVAPQFVEKRPHAGGHDAAIPAIRERPNRRLLEQLARRRKSIEKVRRFAWP